MDPHVGVADMARLTESAAHWLGGAAHHIEHDVVEALHHLDMARHEAATALALRQQAGRQAGGRGKAAAGKGVVGQQQLAVPSTLAQPNGFALLFQPLKWSRSARTLLAGAGSAAVSKTATSPLEVLRIKMMTGGKGQQLGKVVQETWKGEGDPCGGGACAPSGSWRLTPPALRSRRREGVLQGQLRERGAHHPHKEHPVRLLRRAPTSASASSHSLLRTHCSPTLRFPLSSHSALPSRPQAFKIALARPNPVTGKSELPPWGSFAAGSLSGIVSTVATHPMETLQTRLAVSAVYKSAGDAVMSIIAKEGPLALFGGLAPSLIGIIPYAGLNLGFYDGLRTLYTKQTGQPVPKTASLVFGALAGASAATVTFPLEVVRRRMMMGAKFANTGAAIVGIAKAEGVGALFAGLGLNWIKVAPSSGLSIWSYELLKDQLKV